MICRGSQGFQLHTRCRFVSTEEREKMEKSEFFWVFWTISFLPHPNNFLGKNVPFRSNRVVSKWELLICSRHGTLSLSSGSQVTRKNGDSKLDRCTTKEWNSLLKDGTQKLEWPYDTKTVLSVYSQLKSCSSKMYFLWWCFFQLMKRLLTQLFLQVKKHF